MSTADMWIYSAEIGIPAWVWALVAAKRTLERMIAGSWSGGSTAAWRRVRAAVLQRDRDRCRLNIPDVCVQTSVPMHVHHIHGKASGCPGCKADRPDHLIATCAPCNLHVGNPASAADPAAIPVSRW